MAASTAANTPETPTTVAIAVCSGDGSRRAVRWAAENLVPHAQRLLLLHVIPCVSSVPSPSGDRIPIHQIERDVVEMYIEDLKAKSQKVFDPFKRVLSGRRNVETLVLDGENPAEALVKYITESGVQNFVLGSSSMSWIRRILKSPDLPTAVLKSAPKSCNVFVVSRHKLRVKFVNGLVNSGFDEQLKRMSHKAFRKQSYIFGKQLSVHSSDGNDLSRMSIRSDVGPETSICSVSSVAARDMENLVPYSGHNEDGNLDNMSQELQKYNAPTLQNIPFATISHSLKEGDALPDVLQLRLELQKTVAMYNSACGDLVCAKKKVQLLSNECFEEAKKVKEALEREQTLKRIASEEMLKQLEVTKEVQDTRKMLLQESLDRHKAETIASEVLSEKSKIVDALFSNDIGFRLYSMSELEIATDNFSDANKIGEGSFGNVYKGNLEHTLVAIKVLRQDTIDKQEEFFKEVEVFRQLRHPHVVLLLGICPESRCLVYEYMENRSLEDQLLYGDGTKPLPWFIRFNIIYEVALGLAFLHGTKPEPIVHRDLKPGNILLDGNYVSKIGDVGLAKLISDVAPDGLTEYTETILAGTLYYMDPEYQRTGTLRPKSDLYALGIIALQLLTGRHPNGLLMKVEAEVKAGSLANVLDKSVLDWPIVEAEKLAKIALKCCRLRCRERPDLESEVLPVLEELFNMANVCIKLQQSNVYAPSLYICPILQEVMVDPYIAADGYTYEHKAIKMWLETHNVSPVTKLCLPHTAVIPNHTLRTAIEQWKAH